MCTVHSGRCYFILTDRGNRVENETAGSHQKKTNKKIKPTLSKHPEELPKAKCYASRLEEEQKPGEQIQSLKRQHRAIGAEKKEKDGERTEHSKEVLDKNKIRERDRGQEGAEGIQEDARRTDG